MGHPIVRQTPISSQTRFPSPTSIFVSGLIILLLSACTSPARKQTADPLLVSAASNLILAFEDIGARYEEESGTPVIFNFAASGQLAQQIEQGAPVDLFVSANTAYVEDLAARGRVLPDSVQIYARGRLTIWTRDDASLTVETLGDMLKPEVRLIAIANPEHAPYGVAARQALQTAGLWEAIQSKLVLGENVRQALQYAEKGNADGAIVPLSLSIASEGHWTLIPEDFHTPIDQALGVVADSPRQAQAQAFAAFITSAQGQAILQEYGFMPPGEVSSP
jgi:molybdate transport system substrate-binding protein